MPHESAAALIRIAKDASHDGLTVAVSGVSVTNEEAPRRHFADGTMTTPAAIVWATG